MIDFYLFQSRVILLFLPLFICLVAAYAFHKSNFLSLSSPRQFERILTSLAVDPGKLLYEAAYAGDLDKMKIVLKECKGKPDQLNWSSAERYGRTPLVIASYYNQVEAVKLLLSTPGVDVNKGIAFSF